MTSFGLEFLKQSPQFFILITTLGLCIGSFLNVVIFRLPKMLIRDWNNEANSILELPSKDHDDANLTLLSPRSHCADCKQTITWWANIPVFSYLLLRGRCSHCKEKISTRYPIVEIICAALSITVAIHFSFSWETLAALLFTWGLLALTFIDIDHQLLPDEITLPLLWLGIIVNLFGFFTPTQDAIIGAVLGYVSLWSVSWVFKKVTGKVGMGNGDFKLLSLLGAWLGWKILPLLIFVASVSGIATGIIFITLKNKTKADPIPFGPHLAVAGWLILMASESTLAQYFNFFNLS